MRKITVKVITISSQILVAMLFLLSLFNDKGYNDKVTIVYNDNFDKMADRTLFLFEKEEFMTSNINENVIVVLEDNTVKEFDETIQEEIIIEDVIEESVVEESSNTDVSSEPAIETYTGILTGYGPDCAGCGNFNTGKVSTASGYHVSNIVDGVIEPAFTVTYNDSQYGEVRIVAADDSIPFYSIVRITIPGSEPITTIVLDRGSTVGFENCRSDRGCLTNFDLLFASESDAIGKTHNVKFELLRSGI